MEHLNEILSFLNKQPKNNQNIVDINNMISLRKVSCSILELIEISNKI
jgi:hypothetical protein